MATKSKTRNYTAKEKQLFIKIVQKYSHVVENKKNSAASLQDKEVAWERIVNEYNASTLIEEKRCEKQLRKLWTNLKQSQRDALTKEKQSRFLTGGGPPAAPAAIDPDISAIVPNLMMTAPALFTSTLDEETLIEREHLAICDDVQKIFGETMDDDELCEVIHSLCEINKAKSTFDLREAKARAELAEMRLAKEKDTRM